MRKPVDGRPWARRAKRVSTAAAGFGVATLGGFVVGLLRRRHPTRYLSSEPPPEPVDEGETTTDWLT
jgi:hypothetical protein